MSVVPISCRICAQAIPLAPAPLNTTFTSSKPLPTTFSALIAAASVTTAVPCWSSWNTGIPMSIRFSSM